MTETYQVRDGARIVTFEGELLAEVSSERPTSPRWTELKLYKTDTEGRTYDLMQVLVEEEALAWPVPVHDDLLDVISRIFDLEDFSFPDGTDADEEAPRERYKRPKSTTWMSR